MSWRGKPSRIWSDHGMNFVGVARELKELYAYLRVNAETHDCIFVFCSQQGIEWCFTPKAHSTLRWPWGGCCKEFQTSFQVNIGSIWLTFEELTTIATQIEACLNSRPLTPLPSPQDATEVLTPGWSPLRGSSRFSWVSPSAPHATSLAFLSGTREPSLATVVHRVPMTIAVVHHVAISISQLASRPCCLCAGWTSSNY